MTPDAGVKVTQNFVCCACTPMATKRKRGSAYQYIIKRAKLLPRPIFLTFDSEAEGDAYVARLEKLLDNGIVPDGFIKHRHELRTISDVIDSYLHALAVPKSDEALLRVVAERVGSTELRVIDYSWCEQWVAAMKQQYRLAPSTIRHHVGALARCLDWVTRRHPGGLVINHLRQMPRRYSSYSPIDRRVTDGGREDNERDRRLAMGEEERIRSVLAGSKPNGRERALALPWQGALECTFTLALETAMRLREIFTLEIKQIDLGQQTIFLEKTKNGDRRQVPLSGPAQNALKRYIGQVRRGDRRMTGFDFEAGRLFPWWNGNQLRLNATTSLLSRQFARVFHAAGCRALRFHDLRHEATCRFYERTKLSDLQIAKITGHKDIRILRRYANLRGSDLAKLLW